MNPVKAALLSLAMVSAIVFCGIGIYTADAANGHQAVDGYGVTAAMYPIVGEVLLATLAEGLGAEFTPEVERNWREAYGTISAVILRT